MSQFYASIQGSRGEATRQGTKSSGIEGHIRGWHTGAFVVVYYDKETKQDHVRVYKTTGSHNRGAKQLIAEWDEDSKASAFYK